MKNKYFLEFSSQLLKEERIFLKELIERYLKKEKIEFLLNEIELPKLKNCKKKFIERLAKKGVFLIETNKQRVYCQFFNCVIFKNDSFKIYLNPEFTKYLLNKEKKINYCLKEALFLKNSFAIEFFFKILKLNTLKSVIEIELEELKNILIIESYSRLYDLKRFVLNPLVQDINDNTDYNISFSLEKIGKSHKVIFKIQNSKLENLKIYTNYFLKLYKNYILDKKKMECILFDSMAVNNYEYVETKIIFTIKNKKKYNLNFDTLLENVLSNKVGEFYIALKTCEVEAKNIDQFRKYIHKEIYPLNFSEIIRLDYNTNLAKQLFSIKSNEFLEIISENLKLELLFNPEGKSKINIYIKYIK
ncbi:MAG: hypothetical protein ACRCZR_04480 [Cetobacterium sp.]